MPSCVLLLGDKPRQSWPEKFSEDGPLGTSHLPFSILVPEYLPAGLWSQLKSEASLRGWPPADCLGRSSRCRGPGIAASSLRGCAGGVALGLAPLCVTCSDRAGIVCAGSSFPFPAAGGCCGLCLLRGLPGTAEDTLASLCRTNAVLRALCPNFSLHLHRSVSRVTGSGG